MVSLLRKALAANDDVIAGASSVHKRSESNDMLEIGDSSKYPAICDGDVKDSSDSSDSSGSSEDAEEEG